MSNTAESFPKISYRFIGRVLVKAALLFVLCNLIFAVTRAGDALQALSWYGIVVPARPRLPYGENPQQAYNFTVTNLDAMMASHAVSQPVSDDEFRVFVLGDSANWGILLRPDETLTGQLNTQELTTPDGQPVRFYNLGYPTMSLMKDLVLLDATRRYQPDALIWRFTAQSFPDATQYESPVLDQQAAVVNDLIARYRLSLDPLPLDQPSLLANTIPAQRRLLSDWLRLQLYGVAWAATGIDQVYPAEYTPASRDLSDDTSWQQFDTPDQLSKNDLAFDILAVADTLAIPVLYINEPMLISSGENSDLRYNFFYPRWAYDQYRQWLRDEAESREWVLLDAWDSVPSSEFTDSPVHMTAAGEAQLAQQVIPMLQDLIRR